MQAALHRSDRPAGDGIAAGAVTAK